MIKKYIYTVRKTTESFWICPKEKSTHKAVSVDLHFICIWQLFKCVISGRFYFLYSVRYVNLTLSYCCLQTKELRNIFV